MANSVTIYLPLSQKVIIQSFVNAAMTQQVVIQPEVGNPITWQGQGYYDKSIGQTSFTTPASSKAPQGFAMTVNVNHSNNGGYNWQPSQVGWAPCRVMYYNLFTVASEDPNNTWDDCTTYFSWSTPPQAEPQEII